MFYFLKINLILTVLVVNMTAFVFQDQWLCLFNYIGISFIFLALGLSVTCIILTVIGKSFVSLFSLSLGFFCNSSVASVASSLELVS